MSLFQHVAVWALRAMVVWGVIEFGIAGYTGASEQIAALSQIQSHQSAMARLTTRTDTAEQNARAIAARMRGNVDDIAFSIPAGAQSAPPAIAAANLRDALIAAGAEAPMVEPQAASQSGPLINLVLQTRWREQQMSAPAVIHAIAAHSPNLRLRALRLATSEAMGSIEVEAEFEALVRVVEANP